MRRLTVSLLCLLLMLCCCAHGAAGELRVDFFDVGKADAMLITTPDGAHILIDTATNAGGKTLVKRLTQAGIDTIDLMIITHFDKDHVGGADKLIDALHVARVVMPSYDKQSKQLTQLEEALAASPQTDVVRMGAGDVLHDAWGDVQLTLTAAHEPDYGEDEENDFSLAAALAYGDTRFLFTGDAEDARLRELLEEGDVACDVLKVPYHGRFVEASTDFLTAAQPSIAFIPDSVEDPADTRIVQLLRQLGALVLCAKDGDATVCSDGKQVYIP